MGTDVHLVATGADERALDRAIDRLAELEARWSRFRPDSELSRLNASAGVPTVVSTDTVRALVAAIDAWHRTGGRFDPTVGAAVIGNGYDRTFEELVDDDDDRADARPSAAPGCADVHVDEATNLVWLPLGTRLDLGGIGKGLAADWLSEQLLHDGATAACVNIGGDVRVAGDEEWVIAVEHPDEGEIDRITLLDGAVATSSTRRRRWTTRNGTARHHVVDPTTGAPTADGTVTVVAATATEAEVQATALLVGGRA